jgi:iron complex transport system permease protein
VSGGAPGDRDPPSRLATRDAGAAGAPAGAAADRARTLDRQRARVRRLELLRGLALVIGAGLTLGLMLFSLTLGSAAVPVGRILAAVLHPLQLEGFSVDARTETIVWVLRMPRIAVAALAGAILGMGGCVTQAILKNPLATPYTLGVSAGAGFGAALGIIFGVAFLPGTLAIVANAFLFALIPAGVIIAVSGRAHFTPETTILLGVGMSYVFGAANTLLQFFAESDALRTAVFWLVGDLTRASMTQVPVLATVFGAFLLVNLLLARDLTIIKMGDEDAKGMGVDVRRLRFVVLLTTCLATAAVISFTGTIGFIGLLAPHIARLVIGSDERVLIPASALLGACLLLTADIVAKTVVAPVLLPVGAITALLGGPVLIYLLLRRRA